MGHGFWNSCWSGLYGGHGGWSLFGPWINLLFMLVIGVGLVWFMIWAIRRFTFSPAGRASYQNGTSQMPLDILKARYARGEISREEYREMKKDIG